MLVACLPVGLIAKLLPIFRDVHRRGFVGDVDVVPIVHVGEIGTVAPIG